jgi:hypothetical protein
MLTTFFDVKGLVFHPQDQNMIQTVHETYLECFGGVVCWNSPPVIFEVPASCIPTMCHVQWA